MVWLLPAALAGLAAVLGPLIVHLLRRQRARTVVIPTVQFIPAVDQSVVRVRRPADLLLLLVRMAIIACAALALARPLFLTDSRAAGWADRIVRVAVVDTSNPSVAPMANEAAAAELTSATFSHRIDATQLDSALRRGSAWLNAAPPGRRELVVVSDFRLGSIDESLVRGVPATIGVRLIPVRAEGEAIREIMAGPSLGPEVLFGRRVRIDAATTTATFSRGATSIVGLTLLVSPEDQADAARLLRVAARAGVHAPLSHQPIIVRFAGGRRPSQHQERTSPQGWAPSAALRLLRHADQADLPVTAAIGEDGALVVDVNARPGTVVAAEALRAILDARPDPGQLSDQEIAHIPRERLEALGRPSPPADTAAWQRSGESDGRWFWLGALALMGVEAWIRRGRSAALAISEVDAHAA